MNDFAIIPALDLKGGAVVHARGGARAEYRPIETPLGAADDPVALTRALIAVTGSSVLYIADLDAIEGVGNHFDVCRDLASALPGSELWIDAGFTNVTDCAFWLPLGATLVIGTESLSFAEDWQELRASFGGSLVLFGEVQCVFDQPMQISNIPAVGKIQRHSFHASLLSDNLNACLIVVVGDEYQSVVREEHTLNPCV
jgi:phosphoribosylformimino-5-aminoimidazole carboxamide ribonucleotide (ProFAR) isomerase